MDLDLDLELELASTIHRSDRSTSPGLGRDATADRDKPANDTFVIPAYSVVTPNGVVA